MMYVVQTKQAVSFLRSSVKKTWFNIKFPKSL